MSPTTALDEAARIMGVCNACRYCEGYCPVFPAMERRLSFAEADLVYLANLCHHCQACYYACQYAPPHEFAVNVPRTLAELRRESWATLVWPQAFAPLFARNGLVVCLAVAAGIALLLAATVLAVGGEPLLATRRGPGSFYQVIPHEVLVGLFGAVFLCAIAALSLAVANFRRRIANPDLGPAAARHWRIALGDAASLRHLDGGGDGCTYPDGRPSNARRIYHHFTAYGFALCFAATCAGTVLHYAFGLVAPYGYFSLPVVLGTLGGLGLVIGPAGLIWLKGRADREPADPHGQPMDVAFLLLLMLTSLTGFALLALRDGAAMGLLLAIHLGTVLALFLTLPYGRFVHGAYRLAALLRAAVEREKLKPTGAGE